MQAMWSNTLDSDVVKDFVAFGTEIIKVIDKIGLLNSALIALATYSMFKHKMGPISFFKSLFEMGKQGISWTESHIRGLKNVTLATDDLHKATITLTQAQLKEKLTSQGLTDNVAEQIVANTNLGKATDELSASTLDAVLREKGYSKEKREAILQTVFDTQATDENTQANKENANSNQQAGAAEDKDTIDTKENIAVTKEDTRVTKENTQANKENANSNNKLGTSIKAFGGKIGAFAKEYAGTLIMLGTTLLTTLLVKVTDRIVTTMDEMKDEFNESVNELNATNSELSNLQSQLKEINNQIDELKENTPLTFADQEELSRLQAQSAEIQRQIDLTETLKKQQAIGVNEDAMAAANKYKDVGVKSGKTTGQATGDAVKVAGGIGVAATGAAATMAAFGTAMSWNVVGWIALAAAAVTAAVGGIAYAISSSEEKVGDSLDNMKEQYTKLQEEFNIARENYQNNATDKNKKKFEEAQDALRSYQSNMAGYMTEMDSYYQQIRANWDTATEDQKKAATEWSDQMDTWAIQTGGTNAKSNAIARIFGDEATGDIATARDEINKLKKNLTEAKKNGEGVDEALAALEGFELNLSEDEVKRLREMGIYLYEVEDYFKEVVKAESEFIDNDLEDVAKDINKITEGLGSLKSAFEEAFEAGVLSAKSVLDVKDALNIGTESTEELTNAWREYLSVMMSGTATTEEMTRATEGLAQAYINEALIDGSLAKNKMFYIAQLQMMGVSNAEQYVEDMLQKQLARELESQKVVDRSAVAKHYSDASGGVDVRNEVNAWTEEEVQAYVKEHNLLVGKSINITDDYKQQIMDAYGVEAGMIDGIIEKLKEKQRLENDIAKVQARQEDYNTWLNGDGENLGYQAVLEEMTTTYARIADVAPEVANFNQSDWIQHAYNRWLNSQTGEIISDSKYRELWSAHGLYKQQGGGPEYEKLKALFDQLWEYGISNGYLDQTDGILKLDTQSIVDEANGKIKKIKEEIDKEITIDVQMQLELQDAHKKVDDIQNIFDTLVNAQKEYDENGYVSVDTLQQLLLLEPKYLDLLVDEEGNLNLTKDALYNVARARITDMGLKQQEAILDNALQLATTGTKDAILQEITVMEMAMDTEADWIQSKMALIKTMLMQRVAEGDLTSAESTQFMAGITSQLNAVNTVTQSALDNLENSLSSAGNTAKAETEDAFQKAMDYWENRISANRSLYEQIQNDIDLLEKQGKIAGESYYEAQMAVENERLEHLQAQRAEATQYLNSFQRGSEDWWSAAQILNDIENEIDDVTASLQDLADAMAQVHWTIFDEAHERMDDLQTQLSNVREILSADEDSFFTDEGEWTETGVAVLATHIQELELYKSTLVDVKKEMDAFAASYTGNEDYYKTMGIDSEQEYYDKLTELTEKQHEYTLAISDSEQSVVEMYESSVEAIEEYTQTLVDSYNDYIDSVKEALDAERDLYNFKKNIQRQTKDIATLERRIASLSGSTNASDIAERRRLEADLYGAREELDDTYYEHAKETQQEALDSEAQAYEEHMTRFIEELHTSLEEATRNMDEFLASVTSMVALNADIVLQKYQSTELPLSTALTNPWEIAKKAAKSYSGDALALMNEWTRDGGFFDTFNTIGSTDLKSPFAIGTQAAQGFASSVGSSMSSVYTSIKSNVENSITQLNALKQKYAEIQDAAERANNSGGANDGGGKTEPAPKQWSVTATVKVGSYTLTATGTGKTYALARSAAQTNLAGEYQKFHERRGVSEIQYERMWSNTSKKIVYEAKQYAKGTTSTTRDEWAITDEPQFGDELTMYATPEGTLSFMRAGSTVVPADITKNLIEWGQFTPDSTNFGGGVNANIINNAVNKPELNITFDSLVKAENITEETLPAVKKLVTQELNRFTKELNYALKGKGAR